MRTPTPRGIRARLCSQSTPGRIAAARMKPSMSSAMTGLIFQSASAATTIESAASVTVAARRAVLSMARGLWPCGEASKPMVEGREEQICLDSRRHGVVLVRPFLRALLFALCGLGAFLGGWPLSAFGAFLLCLAALIATARVWRAGRPPVRLTPEKLFVAQGLLPT